MTARELLSLPDDVSGPAEVYPPGEFILDELEARGWTIADLAGRMGGDLEVDQCTVELLVFAPSKGLILCPATATKLGRALGVSPKVFLELDRAWREGETNGQ